MAKSVASLLPGMVAEAVRRKAADIIFSFSCAPALKVDEKLVILEEYGAVGDHELEGLTKLLLPASKQKILAEERQVDFSYAQKEARFRVNIFFQRGHLGIVMRYVRAEIPKLEDLGLPGIVTDLLKNDNGLILMVGPTGSGKSTSLAAMVNYLNLNEAKHIITIEDPIEYIYPNKKSIIQQREIGLDATSFPAALRSALREAPDVILLGEMRDLESISTAITVAETGHLVLSTIHANTAPGTIDRIIDIFPEGGKEQIRIQLADILLAVLNQRLVPKADGSGSTLMVEVMIANSAVKNAIRSSNTSQLPNIIQTSSAEGMYLLDDLLAKAVKQGHITKETALGYASDREGLKKSI